MRWEIKCEIEMILFLILQLILINFYLLLLELNILNKTTRHI